MAVVTEDLGRCSRLWLPLPAMLMNLIFSEGVAGDAGGDALGVAGDGAATGPSMEGARIAPDPSRRRRSRLHSRRNAKPIHFAAPTEPPRTT